VVATLPRKDKNHKSKHSPALFCLDQASKYIMSIFALEDLSHNIFLFSLSGMTRSILHWYVASCGTSGPSSEIAETLYIRNRIELRDGQLLVHLPNGTLRRRRNLHIVFEADNMTSKIIQQFERLLSSLESLQNVYLDADASNRKLKVVNRCFAACDLSECKISTIHSLK